MRKAFVDSILSLAEKDDSFFLLTADLGFNFLEPFARKFPNRFLNVGVSEQNMIGVATGLAEGGFTPWCYSITNFSVLRPLEFIRNGPVQHQLKVRIIGMGAGMDYSTCGFSHYGLEDIGMLRVLPGLTVVAPADSRQATLALHSAHRYEGPVYFRLSKDDSLQVEGLPETFEIGRHDLVHAGTRVLVVCFGGITQEGAKAVAALRTQGKDVGFLVVSSFRPWDHFATANLLRPYQHVVTVETHFLNGALGSAMAETIATQGLDCRLHRMGVADLPDGTIGSHSYKLESASLSAPHISDRVASLYDTPIR